MKAAAPAASLLLSILLASACESNPPPVLGDSCAHDWQCGDLICEEGECTRACASDADCAEGTDCRPIDGRRACVEKRFGTYEGAYGTNCTIDGDLDCAGGYNCAYRQPDDPFAYCTAACQTDRECPHDYGCVAAGGDGERRCQKRDLCWSCERDSDCVSGWLQDGFCEDFGGVKYCSKSCDPAGLETCPIGYWCDGDSNPERPRCSHVTTACYGTGQTCDPCRTQEDCEATPGSICVTAPYTGERFCSAPCDNGSCPGDYECQELSDGDETGHCIPEFSTYGFCWPQW